MLLVPIKIQNIRDTFFHMLYSLIVVQVRNYSDGFVIMKGYEDIFTTVALAPMLLTACILKRNRMTLKCVLLERSLSVQGLYNDVKVLVVDNLS